MAQGKMKSSNFRRKKSIWAIRGALVLWTLTFLLKNVSTLEGVEVSNLDYASRLRVSRHLGDSSIMIVPITGEDFADIFHRNNPLDPRCVIKIVNVIAAGNPELIAVDLDTSDERYLLYRGSLRTTVPIIWATRATSNVDGHLSDGKVNVDKVLGYGVTPDIKTDQQFYVGIIDLPEIDGVIRSYQHMFQTRNLGPIDAFAFAVFRQACQKQDLSRGPCHAITNCTGDSVCSQSVFIRYSADDSLKPPAPSAGDLVQLAELNQGVALKRILQNKIVFLGGWFPQSNDLHETPVGMKYGVAIHAEAFASELSGERIPVPNRVRVVSAELSALLLLIVVERKTKRFTSKVATRVWIILLGIGAFSVGLSVIAFGRPEFFLSFVPLLGGVFLDLISDVAAEGI